VTVRGAGRKEGRDDFELSSSEDSSLKGDGDSRHESGELRGEALEADAAAFILKIDSVTLRG
jgi:hypothetical protein